MADRETILFDNGVHKCIMFSFDDEEHEDSFLSVNQFLIVQNNQGVLIDPGSESIFDEMCDAVSAHIPLENIKFIFLSHQDPDVSGAITQWSIATNAKFIMSALWVRFMSHYGFMDMARIMALPDHGAKLKFGAEHLDFVPSHFLHSPGNFSLYDSASKVLFSGDIGAAILPAVENEKFVHAFSEHVGFLEGFHKRYMASNKVCKAWVNSLKDVEISMIAPQHGYVFKDDSVTQFLEWFGSLECGSDMIENLYK
jgi:flavorubredoxin